MEESIVILVSTNKDGGYIQSVDSRGNALSQVFKSSIVESGAICSLVKNRNCYSGLLSAGDYIATAHPTKPQINLYQWGKQQSIYQCHTQEIVTSLQSDATGTYLYAGTRKGNMYIWNVFTGELLTVWQAHFKTITKIAVTSNGQFCITISEDGMGRAWDMSTILDTSLATWKSIGSNKVSPYRSWNSHTLAIKDLYLIDTQNTLRVLTCSQDHTVCLYDILSGKNILKISLPQAIQSITCTPSLEYILCGGAQGDLFLIDFSIVATGFTLAGKNISRVMNGKLMQSTQSSNNQLNSQDELPQGVSKISAHQKAINTILFLKNQNRIVTGSDDGLMKIWDLFTRQLIQEVTPLGKLPISNLSCFLTPELFNPTLLKPFVCPIQPLKKYQNNTDNNLIGVKFLSEPILLNNELLMSSERESSVFSVLSSLRGSSTQHIPEKQSSNVKQSLEKADKMIEEEEKVENPPENEKEEKEEAEVEEEEHFISLTHLGTLSDEEYDLDDDNEETDETNQNISTKEAIDEEESKLLATKQTPQELPSDLQTAIQEIEKLKQEKIRWEKLCFKMKDHIQHLMTTKEDSINKPEKEQETTPTTNSKPQTTSSTQKRKQSTKDSFHKKPRPLYENYLNKQK